MSVLHVLFILFYIFLNSKLMEGSMTGHSGQIAALPVVREKGNGSGIAIIQYQGMVVANVPVMPFQKRIV
jgi:hypothetical protein